MTTRNHSTDMPETKRNLLDAGIKLMRQQGFNATSVDDICAAAGVTKGAFFYYFKSKDELAKAALEHFSEGRSQEFLDAPFRKLADPLDRVYARLDYVLESVGGGARVTKGCLIGLFAQELAFTHPELRHVCQDAFLYLAADFEKDLAAAKREYAPDADFDPKRLAIFYVSLFQGSSLMAKAADTNKVLVDNLDQFRSYLKILFGSGHHPANAGQSGFPQLITADL